MKFLQNYEGIRSNRFEVVFDSKILTTEEKELLKQLIHAYSKNEFDDVSIGFSQRIIKEEIQPLSILKKFKSDDFIHVTIKIPVDKTAENWIIAHSGVYTIDHIINPMEFNYDNPKILGAITIILKKVTKPNSTEL